MKKNYLKVILFSIIVLLCVFCFKSTVLGVEKIEDIKDFNYIPKENYVLIENDKGSFKKDNNGNRYFYYEGIQQYDDILEIIHKDGTKCEYKYEGYYDDYVHYKNSKGEELSGIDSDGKYKRPDFLTNQENVHWKLGTNYATIEFLGIKKQISVKIIESPVKAIKYIPVSNDVIHTKNARVYSNNTDYYNVQYGRDEKALGDKLEVEYKNGTKKSYTYREIDKEWEENGTLHSYFDEDFYDDKENKIESDVYFSREPNAWKAGKNNYLVVRFLGVEYRVPIEIVEDEHKYVALKSKDGNITYECAFCGRTYFPKTMKLSSTSFKYNGKVHRPTVILKNGKGKTVSKSNYTIKYSNKNSKKVGEYKITIKFKGDYKGTKVLTYKIKPKGATIKKVTANKKAFKVNWYKNTTQTSGYEIKYSTNSKFKSENKTINIKSNKTTSKTVKNLKKNKKYYVKIRTYKTVKGKKIYSSWSKVLKVKTK